jgi:predicted site-specific integrase-resolvase
MSDLSQYKSMYKGELAALYGVSLNTIKRWANKAKVKLPKGRCMIPGETIRKLIAVVGEP